MKMKLIYGFGLALLATAVSCSRWQAGAGDSDVRDLRLLAHIQTDAGNVTKAGTEPVSVKQFASGHEIGFYAQGGDPDNSGGPLDNIRMYFGAVQQAGDVTYSSFISDKEVDYSSLGLMSAYYPYYEAMEPDGMPIREENGMMKDILFAHSGSLGLVGGAGIAGSFIHVGAMVIIDCGEGFSNAENQEITITMNHGVEKMRIVPGKSPLFKAFGWVESDDEKYRDYKTDTYTDNGTTCYYAILPTSNIGFVDAGGLDLGVASITLYDDSGTAHTIPTPSGKYEIAGLLYGNKYRVTVKMDKLVPTIYPHEIEEWNGNDITGEQEVGIGSYDELRAWIEKYNADNKDEEALKKYGNKSSDGKWTFYLTNDIDCSSMDARASYINVFQDKLDGRGFTLENISLSSTLNEGAGLIKTLVDGAYVENLNIRKITVTDDSGYPVGSIVSDMQGGTVGKCSVSGANINGKGYAGILSGTMSGGTVSDCTFEGSVVGKRLDKTTKLTGNLAGGSVEENNNTANVIYNDID